jgi:hypothetical protein
MFFVKKAHIFDIRDKPVLENRGKSGEKLEHYGKKLSIFLTIFTYLKGILGGRRRYKL